MTKIHIVYPHGNAESCPDRIGRALKDAFKDSYEVVLHNWDATYRIRGHGEDLILGHPHPAPWTVFNRSVRRGEFRKAVAISPLSTGDLRNQAFIAHSVKRCDFFIALGGDYWRGAHADSAFGGLTTPMAYLDLGVDGNVFKLSELNEPGFLYIGHNHWTKNISYLSEISSLLPNLKFGFLGAGKPIDGFEQHGRIPLQSKEAKEVLSAYSHLLIASRSDANPAVLLEAMALGLLPICTPQCGFVEGSDRYRVLNIPLDDAQEASRIIQDAANWEQEMMSSIRSENRLLVTANYSWESFSSSVRQLVDQVESNRLGRKTSVTTKLNLLFHELRSPLFPFHSEGRRIWGAPLVKTFRSWLKRNAC